MRDVLDGLDRTTLIVWRVANPAWTWCVAVVLSFWLVLTERAVRARFLADPFNGYVPPGQEQATAWIFGVITAFAVGGLVGVKSWWRPSFIAGLALLPYLLGDAPARGVATIAVAMWWAGQTSRRARPLARGPRL